MIVSALLLLLRLNKETLVPYGGYNEKEAKTAEKNERLHTCFVTHTSWELPFEDARMGSRRMLSRSSQTMLSSPHC